MKLPILIVFLCLAYSTYGQNLNTDSLELLLENSVSDNRLDQLSTLARNYSTKDSAKAIEYADEALRIAVKSEDKKKLVRAYMDIGTIKRENFQYNEADEMFLKADSISQIISYTLGRGSARKALGNSIMSQGYPEQSLSHFQLASRLFESINDTASFLGAYYNIGFAHYKLRNYDSATYYYFRIIPHCDSKPSKTCLDMYNQLGTVYSELNEPVKALQYLQLSLHGSLNNKDSVSAANTYMNIAGNYFYQGKMDSCAYFVNQSILIYDKMGHLQGQVYGLNNLAIIYKETGQTDKSFEPTKRAIELAKKINDRATLSGSYLNLADLNHLIKRHRLAELYADSALVIMKELKSKYHIRQYYEVMTRIKKAQNDLNAAFDMREMYHVYKDSMVNEQKNKQIAELETKYETEKKEQQISILSAEKDLQAAVIKQNELQLERNQAYIIMLIALVGAIVALGIFLIKRQQYAQKISIEEERNAMKADQIRAVINSQEEERSRFAMDLHDDFGQLISALRMNISSEKNDTGGKANNILDDMYASLKNIAFNLMPQTLVNNGLTAAVDELFTQLNDIGSMRFNLRTFAVSEDDLPDAHKVAIYRIIQEVVNNIIKYANAEKVDINMTGLDEGISIMIEDDGMGFDLSAFTGGSGNGWRNIRSRLDLVHGEIEYDTQLNRRNSTVSITIPFVHEQRSAA